MIELLNLLERCARLLENFQGSPIPTRHYDEYQALRGELAEYLRLIESEPSDGD